MKKRINEIFFLVMLSLIGIVAFQVYWCVNAYHVNKKNFDANIDLAMQKAMDDCKKDYFDSIRKVIVKRLSLPETVISVDTPAHQTGPKITYIITLFDPPSVVKLYVNKSDLDSYSRKVGYHANLQQTLTEMSFYDAQVREQIKVLLGVHDSYKHMDKLMSFLKTHGGIPSDTLMKYNNIVNDGLFAIPSNVKDIDKLKLRHHLEIELYRLYHITAPFYLAISTGHIRPQESRYNYSETNEYEYDYHGFTPLNFAGPHFYVKAFFHNPQYSIIKNMTLILLLSLTLIVSALAGFNYLIKTILQQRKLAELKDDFINNMTHELKTPIATLTVAIEGLQKFNALNDPEKTQRYLQTSRTELSRLNDLVTKVLNISAFEHDKIDLVKEEMNVDELMKDVIASEQLRTEKRVDIDYKNSGLSTIIADKLHFRNVLVNLVDNAIKYSGEHPKITITCLKSGNEAIFSVKDNGHGIPKSHTDQIFEKFHRVPTGNIHNVKGTGLGLSYVKYIVEAHGGTVTVKSEINAGSEFIVTLPL